MTVPVRERVEPKVALADIQRPISQLLDSVPAEMMRIVAVDEALLTAVHAHLFARRGKLIRPTLLLLCSQIEGKPEARALSYAAVIELIHVATLVHDDSVDHSVLRRGMPTVNALFTHQVAVIAGDFLYSRAVQELVRLGDLDALAVLAAASNELTVGEMRQLAALDALAFGEEDYVRLIRAKTAALFSAACEVGALCGARGFRERLAQYGNHLGMAFQVADDLLDYTESSDTLGKPVGQDLREHKVTLPLIAALPRLDKRARGVVEELFAAAEPAEDLVRQVIAIVSEVGGLDYARERGRRYAELAARELGALPAGAARSALEAAVSYVMERHS